MLGPESRDSRAGVGMGFGDEQPFCVCLPAMALASDDSFA